MQTRPFPKAQKPRTGLDKLIDVVLALGASSLLVPGIWGYVAPRHFQSVAAPWASLGEHFLRDAGAFQIAIGVVIAAALLWRETVAVVLAGLATGSLLHGISHGIDGDYASAIGIGAIGVLAAVALVLRVRQVWRSGAEVDSAAKRS